METLKDRLSMIILKPYGRETNAFKIIDALTDEEIEEIFEGTAEAMAQEGRNIWLDKS